MLLNVIAFAVPFFLSLMWLEFYIARRRKLNLHSFNESVANINVGIVERLTDLLTTGAFFYFFRFIQVNFGIFSFESSLITWLLLFLLTDLLWYWYHRFGHEINIFWAAHIVHHQSDEFNFTVSARITIFQTIVRCIFWSFLPLVGFSAEMVTLILLIHGAYPFFTHTQLIGKLGWLEYIIVTPSHHRVHHSSNPEYLDKNYGDVLIIWDKLFGTFAPETSKPVYGLTKPIKNHSFLWQHFHFAMEVYLAVRNAKGFKSKINMLFGNPNDIDPRYRDYLERVFARKKWNHQKGLYLDRIVGINTAVTLSVLFLTILMEHYLTSWSFVVIFSFIWLSVISTGAMMEQRRWIFHLDFLRIAHVFCFVFTCYPYLVVGCVSGLVLLLILIYYTEINRSYTVWCYGLQS